MPTEGELVSAIVTLSIFIVLPIYIAYMNKLKNTITYLFIEISIGVIFISLGYILPFTFPKSMYSIVDCFCFKLIVFGILITAAGLFHLVSVFPRRIFLVYAVPSMYIISYFLGLVGLMTPAIVYCSPHGGLRGILWSSYLVWIAMLFLITLTVVHYSILTSPTKVQRIQGIYLVTGLWVGIGWAGAGQFIPTFLSGLPFFAGITALPIAGIFVTIGIVKYRLFTFEASKEKYLKEEKIEVEEGLINTVINEHAAFLAFRRLASKMPGMIITIKPPNILQKRYKIERSPIIWLTYFPDGYKNGISPDKLNFEVMYTIINFVQKGGRVILIHGAEYLVEIYGRNYFLEFLHEVNRIKEGLTIIVSINENRELMEGIADNTVEMRMSIPSPMIKAVKKQDMIGKNNMIIITAKTKEQIEKIYGKGNNVIEITRSFSPDRLVFEGMDKILKFGDKSVFFECFDYVLSSSEKKWVIQFVKDLIDVTVFSGKEVYVLYTPRLMEEPSILSFFEEIPEV